MPAEVCVPVLLVCTVVYNMVVSLPSTSITSISGGHVPSAGSSQNAGQ